VRVSAPALRPQPFAIPHQVQHEFAPVRPSPALAARGCGPAYRPPLHRRAGGPRRNAHHRAGITAAASATIRDESSPGHAALLRNGADVAVALPTGSFFARHRR
jgi:hypothetical protein